MMKELLPIQSEEDYKAALAEAKRLWGAPLGTPDGDRLDRLAALIDAYESVQFPIGQGAK
jgi:HTH-type transcriptional regulator / antitoxin HigA